MTSRNKLWAALAIALILVMLSAGAIYLKGQASAKKVESTSYARDGALALEQGNYDVALADFQAAVRLNPSSSIACIGLAETLERRGLKGEALAQLDSCIARARADGNVEDENLANRVKQAMTMHGTGTGAKVNSPSEVASVPGNSENNVKRSTSGPPPSTSTK